MDTIDAETFDRLLQRYATIVTNKVSDLDKERYETIPAAVSKSKKSACLDKKQVATLVDWKLSHGKFRPTLKGLVQQNADQGVKTTTKEGFEAFTGSADSAKNSLNILTRLRGIGPATASLLLSVYRPAEAPFFSDELFRWAFLTDGKGHGWDREIKYNLKEYMQLFDRVQDLRRRFTDQYQREITAVDIEKVAYVLGKEASHGPENVAEEGSKVNKRKAEGPTSTSAKSRRKK